MPYGNLPRPPKDPSITLLVVNKDPLMPTMLSNSRSNVLKHYNTAVEGYRNYVVFKMIFRNKKGFNVRDIKNANFALFGVEIFQNNTEELTIILYFCCLIGNLGLSKALILNAANISCIIGYFKAALLAIVEGYNLQVVSTPIYLYKGSTYPFGQYL